MSKIKIAIIGAGPSGFAVAEVLKSKDYAPYFDFTIYERNDYVGGKCLTVGPDGRVCNGESQGYEVGAVLASEHASSYSALVDLLDRYDIKRSVFNHHGDKVATYLNKGKTLDINSKSIRQLRASPKKFWNTLRGFDSYLSDYLRYSHSRHVEYINRPKFLNINLSKRYRHEVNERLSGVMQGYGYADLDDKKLTPPLIYYHQYVQLGEIGFPVHQIDTGTQGIWAKISSTYPKDSIRLNEEVIKINRSNLGVEVISSKSQERYDYLVVATPLKPALNYLNFSEDERAFLGKMKHNHYVTVLARVSGFKFSGTFNVQACTNKKYLGRVLCGYKRYPDSDIVALYLYLKDGEATDRQSILNKVELSLKEDFNVSLSDKNQAKIYHWDDYFGHLDTKDLNNNWYEKFDNNFQGQNRTLFVSSGLHMETIGASVEYGTALAKEYANDWLRDNNFS
jgi:protoporphyrinogen oxidase